MQSFISFMQKMGSDSNKNTCMLETYRSKKCGHSKKAVSVVGPARHKSLRIASEQRGNSLYQNVDLAEEV